MELDNPFLNQENVIEKTIRDYWIIIDQYTINSDGSIEVVGNVKFSKIMSFLTELPLKFNKVSGDFDCSRNKLTSLIGSPIEVGGDFDCSYNEITSLEFAPKKVGGTFTFDNMVKSIYTGNKSCNFNEVELYFRTNDPKLIGLSKIITDNACFLPIIFKYQHYYERFDELLEDILDGLE